MRISEQRHGHKIAVPARCIVSQFSQCSLRKTNRHTKPGASSHFNLKTQTISQLNHVFAKLFIRKYVYMSVPRQVLIYNGVKTPKRAY